VVVAGAVVVVGRGVVAAGFVVEVIGVNVVVGSGFIARLTLKTMLMSAAIITGEVISKLFVKVPSTIFLPPQSS
jgi:hypothetical protein